MIEWPWKGCSLSVILVALALERCWGPSSSDTLGWVYFTVNGLFHTDQTLLADIVCCLTLMIVGWQIYSFFEYANFSFQNTPESDTPTRSWLIGNAPETVHGLFGNPFLKQAKERCQHTLQGRKGLLWSGTQASCAPHSLGPKIIVNSFILGAKSGRAPVLTLWMQLFRLLPRGIKSS